MCVFLRHSAVVAITLILEASVCCQLFKIIQRLNGKHFIYFFGGKGGVDMQFYGIHFFQMKCFLNFLYQVLCLSSHFYQYKLLNTSISLKKRVVGLMLLFGLVIFL